MGFQNKEKTRHGLLLLAYKLPTKFTSKMCNEETRAKWVEGQQKSIEAFEECCDMMHKMEEEREERRQAAADRCAHLRGIIAKLKEKNQVLRGKYITLMDKYNELSEEKAEKSDSSDSSDDEGDDNCSLM